MASQTHATTAALSPSLVASCAAIILHAPSQDEQIYQDAVRRVLALPENQKLGPKAVGEIIPTKTSHDLLQLIEQKEKARSLLHADGKSKLRRGLTASVNTIEKLKDAVDGLVQLSRPSCARTSR